MAVIYGTDDNNPLWAPTDAVNPFTMPGGSGVNPYAVVPTLSSTPPGAAPGPVPGGQGLVRNADGSVGTPNAGGLGTNAANVAGPAPVVGSDFASGIAKFESGGKADAQNPYWPANKGGPLGPNQFIASTWQAFAQANPQYFQGMTPEQILQARTDPRLSALATNWYASVNAQHLQQRGIEPTPQNLAIAHALGGGGAASALKYPDTTPLAQIFRETQPGAADAILRMNPQYQKMTLGDLKTKYQGLGTAVLADRGQPQGAPAPVPAIVPGVPNTALTSLAPFASAANATATPLQRFAQLQQLRQLFAQQQPQQRSQASQMPTVGGVNANIPLGVG